MRPRTFHVLSTAFTLAVVACKKEPLPETPPPPPPVPSATATTATATSQTSSSMRPGQRCAGTVVPQLKPGQDVDYLELRLDYYPQGKREIVNAGTHGEACKTAKDVPGCKATLAEARAEKAGEYLVYTRGSDVKTISGKAVGAFLAPIDNADEAAVTLLQALAADTSAAAILPSCDPKEFKPTNDGWETTHTISSFCEAKTVTTYGVSKSGEVKIVKAENTPPIPNCHPPARGRRPEGFTLSSRTDGATIAGHLAEAAEMEAASVPAFERLEAELRALGAPVSLCRRAKSAAADERRHADTMTTLAARFGGSPRSLTLEPFAQRALVEMAIENAIEGCVFETWAALLAHFQAEHASDLSIRSAMKTIARDETRHAALAWDVDAFLSPLLSLAERVRVDEARAAAFARLEAMLAKEPSAELRSAAGLPSSREARRLLEELLQVVDHVAAA